MKLGITLRRFLSCGG